MIAKATFKVLNKCHIRTKMITKDHPLYPKFERLLMQLSPENLYCDGEITQAQVQLKIKRINWEWTLLEALMEGERKVSKKDVEDIFIALLNA